MGFIPYLLYPIVLIKVQTALSYICLYPLRRTLLICPWPTVKTTTKEGLVFIIVETTAVISRWSQPDYLDLPSWAISTWARTTLTSELFGLYTLASDTFWIPLMDILVAVSRVSP